MAKWIEPTAFLGICRPSCCRKLFWRKKPKLLERRTIPSRGQMPAIGRGVTSRAHIHIAERNSAHWVLVKVGIGSSWISKLAGGVTPRRFLTK